MINYDTQLRQFFKDHFQPGSIEKKDTLQLSLSQIYEMVTCVLPKKWIYESDVYSALTELGYKASIIEKEEGVISVYLLEKK